MLGDKMKIALDYDDDMDIYINKFHNNYIDFNDKEALEDYFRNLFFNLKKNYKILMDGFYDIKIYVDNYYGSIIHIENDNNDYCDYFSNQIDMRISVENNSTFLYKIIDLFNIDKKIIKSGTLLKYNGDIYIKLNEDIDDIDMGKLIENSIITFEDTDLILKSGKFIEFK